MGLKGRGLAGRFRRAMESVGAREAREAEEARALEERLAKARQTLLQDLLAFARETGFLEARLRGNVLVVRHGERELHFTPTEEGSEIKVDWVGMDPEEVHRLYIETRLDSEAWVWARKRRMRQREDRELFWDAGLEALLVRGLGLPPPEHGDEEESEPAVDGEPSGRRTL